jgi:xylulokinase
VSPYEFMNLEADQSPLGARGLIFLPYLLGERSPRWNPNARGAFIGLTMTHQRADMIRAVLEGIAPALLEEATSMGAAIAGGVGVGLFPDFSVAERLTPIAAVTEVDPEAKAAYDRLYKVFEAAYQALVPIYDGKLVNWYTGKLVDWETGKPIYRFTNLPVYQSTSLPNWPVATCCGHWC